MKIFSNSLLPPSLVGEILINIIGDSVPRRSTSCYPAYASQCAAQMQPSPEYTGIREEREREREKTWMEKRVSMATGGGAASRALLFRAGSFLLSFIYILFTFTFFFFFSFSLPREVISCPSYSRIVHTQQHP